MMQLYSYYLCDYTETEQKTRHVRYGRLAEIVTGNYGKSAFLVTYGCYGKKTGKKSKHSRVFQSTHHKLTNNKKNRNK